MPGNYPTSYKTARKSTPLTQEQAAEALSVSVESLKAYERGERLPPNGVVREMARLYEAPWLALAHILEISEGLGVLPQEIVIRELPASVLALTNRHRRIDADLQWLMRIAEDGVVDTGERTAWTEISAHILDMIAAGFQVLYAKCAKKEGRPGWERSEPPRSEACAANDSVMIIAQSFEKASPNFDQGGGVLHGPGVHSGCGRGDPADQAVFPGD